MQHDQHLHSVPQTATLHPRRVIELEVWVHFIDKALASAGEALPFAAARNLIRRLEATDAATIRRGNPELSIMMLGVTARTDGGEYALLRNWQNAAFSRIREATE